MALVANANDIMESVLSKKEQRVESKKRKIEALLQLTREEILNNNVADRSHVRPDTPDEPPKRSKTERYEKMTPDELAKFRAELRQRQKSQLEYPKIYLDIEPVDGQTDQYTKCPDGLFVFDVQHLLLYALQGGYSSYRPRWCKLLRHQKLANIVVMVIEGVGATDYSTFSSCFPYISANFNMSVQLIAPSLYGRAVMSELLMVPVTARRLSLHMPCRTDASKVGASVDTNNAMATSQKYGHTNSQSSSRVDLLLNSEELTTDRFPLPHLRSARSKDYVLTKKIYKPVTVNSPMFAIDCEMCETSAGHSELTRIAVVNESLECIYETLVKPRNEITNYLTMYSGVTRKMLKHVHTRIEEVQRVIQEILPSDAILVGHSLKFDLDALKMMHPYIIDTSLLYNCRNNPSWKPSLKRLAAEVLGKQIQTDTESGHHPFEDAVTAMELVQHWLNSDANGRSVVEKVIASTSNVTEQDQARNTPVSVDAVTVMSSNSMIAAESRGNHINDNGSEKSSQDETVCEVVKLNSVTNAVQPDAAFFRRLTTRFQESYFDLVKESKKSAFLAGVGDDSALATNDSTVFLDVDSDRLAVRSCRNAIDTHFVICAHLMDVNRELENHTCVNESECSCCLQRMLRLTDKNIKKLTKSLRPRTLAIVLLAGGSRKSDGPSQNAMCFVRII